MIRLRLFGTVELRSDEGRELRAVLAQPKRLALLAYLAAASPGGFHRRDRLLALFWPELDLSHARDALNAALSFLRREMGRGVIASRGSDEVAIDGTACWCDVTAFRDALDGARHDEALALYRGDLLDGFFTDGSAPFEAWLERTRAQLRAAAARAARSLAERRERDLDLTTAVSCARRAVELSDGDERVLRQLLEMLERLGDRAGALQAYEAFERQLAADLEAEPAPETRALITRIRQRGADNVVVAQPSSGSTYEPGWQALGTWQVEREIGRGGMATVYLARDRTHDRHVALKVMRPELVLASGVDRFLREIQITGRLAHPHILPLIDSGARNGIPYLATPYVAGESLRVRLQRETCLPLDDALRIAAEVAEALDYAHRSGVVHRDVKPENILLADGHAVVADFGIAQALATSGVSADSTGRDEGSGLGSPRYMSPEQAAGSPADVRDDVYALGGVLVEMLTGEVPATTRQARERLAARKTIPASVSRLACECLAEVREHRPPTAAEVMRRLEERRAPGPTPRRIARRHRTTTVALAGAVGVATVLLAWYALGARARWSPDDLGATRQVTNAPGLELDPALSPDGKYIAYAGGTATRMRIYVRPVAGGNAVEVSGGSIRQHRWPSWSPDGTRLAYLAFQSDRGPNRGRLLVVSALGGADRLIADSLAYFSTPAWSPDGRYVAYPLRDSIVLVDITSGVRRAVVARSRPERPVALMTSSSVWANHSLSWSPDGTRLAFVSGNAVFAFSNTAFGNLGPNSIWTIAVDGSAPTRLTTGPFTFGSPVWTADGRGVLYVSNAGGAWDVYFQSIDATGAPNRSPRRLTTGLDAHGISLSRDGHQLAYTRMNYRSNVFAASIHDTDAPPGGARPITDENQTVETVDVTADGKWLVFDSNRSGRSHIYKRSTVSGDLVELTHDAADDFAPVWSPDGNRVAFHRREASKDGLRDIYVVNADGGGLTRITTDSLDHSYPQWTPDGRGVEFGTSGTDPMVSVLGANGRWSAPTPPSGRGRWTRDGRFRLAQQRGQLYLQAVAGPRRPLFDIRAIGGGNVSLGVGPDTTVVYIRVIDTVGVHSFYSIPVDGRAPRLLLQLGNSRRQPARVIFSTDSRNLYFTLTEAESDIWMVTLRR